MSEATTTHQYSPADDAPDTLVLPDGRTLAWWEFGDPAADTVVLNCHGGLMDGRDVALSDEVARERGIRILSPDRPGVGGTSRAGHAGMLPWVHSDVRPLLDHLGITRCAVMGWSEGGQYALAVAHELPAQVTRAAVIAGALPLDDPQNRAHLNRPDRRLAALSEHAPTLAHAYFAAARRMMVLGQLTPNQVSDPLLLVSAQAAVTQLGFDQERDLQRRRRALVRDAGDADEDLPSGEAVEGLAQLR